MRILHTADWHLGAYLGNFSRIHEQRLFLRQLCQILDEEAVDILLIAGDIYDTPNPPAAAEALFYAAMADIAALHIPVVAIAGNHDSAERISALMPMANKLGVFVFAAPNSILPSYDSASFSMRPLGAGCVEIARCGETAIVAAMPFVSEKRLNEAIFDSSDEAAMQRQYSAKIGQLFAKSAAHFRADAVNIAMGHFHIVGSEATGGLERDIQLGGAFAVSASHLPAADYIAMGHLHRAQRIKCGANGDIAAHYAGSPLPYSLAERGQPKSVWLADITPQNPPKIDKKHLNCPKPIEFWEAKTAADAIQRCKTPSNAYKYIVITDEAAISAYDIKEMRRLAPDIVSIELAAEKGGGAGFAAAMHMMSPREEFADFYTKTKGQAPREQILSIFDEILSHEDGL